MSITIKVDISETISDTELEEVINAVKPLALVYNVKVNFLSGSGVKVLDITGKKQK